MLSQASVQDLETMYRYLTTRDERELSHETMTELIEALIVICRREGCPITDDVRAWVLAKQWPGFRGTEHFCIRLTESADVVHHTLRLTGQLSTRLRQSTQTR